MVTLEEGGCVNKAFEAVDDGFQTIDLRNNGRDEKGSSRGQVKSSFSVMK